MRSPSPPEMTGRVSSSASVAREKCSRNKRKFRQDPPFPNQVSPDENHSAGNNAPATVASEGDNWMPETRSVEAATSKSSSADSNQKECDSGTMSAPGKSETTARFYQEHLKSMRGFRSGQGKLSQPGGAVVEEKLEQPTDSLKASNACEEDEFYELEEVDWDDCTEGELEELLVKSLGSLYSEAIGRIVASGHSAEEAVRAVLKQGRCYGGKDAVSNIVENALAYLTGNKYAAEGRDQAFSDLKELQKFGLAEMVGLLREVRPLLSKGDAMWCLLMCDMNVAHACVMEDSALPPLTKESFTGQSTIHSRQVKVASSSTQPSPPNSDSPLSTRSTPNSSNLPSMHPPAAMVLTPADAALPPSSPTSIPASSPILPPLSLPDISPLSLPDSSSLSASSARAETSANFEELASAGSPRVSNSSAVNVCRSEETKDQIEAAVNSIQIPAVVSLVSEQRVDVEQESTSEFDENGRISESHASVICEADSRPHAIAEPSHGALEELPKDKDSDEAETQQGFSCPNASPPVVNKQTDSFEAQSTVNAKGSEKVLDFGSPLTDIEPNRNSQDDSNCIQPENSGSVLETRDAVSSRVKFGTVDEPASTITSEGNVSSCLSSDAESSSSVDSAVGTGVTVQAATVVKVVPECLSKEASVTGKGDMEDQKDEMIMKLIHRAKELEAQLQERSEWAKQKVMQAARRLSKDQQELKALRLEREELVRLKKEKQALEKKLTDSENVSRKSRSDLDKATSSLRKLEVENAEVRAEMEAAKLSASESQASCQEISKRERKYTKRAQAWEKQKAKLQEDISEEKRKITVLQQQLALAKERQQQAEVRWRQEEKGKEEATLRADHERRTREQAEGAAKRREESLRRKAESNYQRHREDIQRLESEIAQLRTSAEAAQLATSRWGPGVAVSPHLMELGSLHTLKEQNIRLSREIADLQDLARRDVRRERECVMCMCEEMSVVFLPCAHQVVCAKCNELHEKQGMRECPSCRTPIKQRIRVYGVSP